LEIEKKVCKYTFTKLLKMLPGTELEYKPIQLSDESAGRSLEILDSTSAKKDDKKDAAKNAIEFSGQIKMPEEAKSEKK
jgi:hypothetical protein